MTIRSLCSGPVETNAYLIIDTESGTAVAVDAPMDSAPWYVAEAQRFNVRITELWLTHSHWDHTADAAALRRLCAMPILLHEADEYRLTDPNSHTVFRMPFELEAERVDRFLKHRETLMLGEQRWEVRHTPGHTEGGVCFVHHEDRIIIAGDTLFHGSIGRTDLPGGDYTRLIQSIRRELLVLEDDYVVYPGHMDETTIGEERRDNQFLQDRV